MHTNLLQGEHLWLLDFEYAQIADPLYDVGCVLAYYPAAQAHAPALLAAACAGARVAPAELAAATYVHGALAWLWHLARGEDAVPPRRA
jgi:thiamine kinase-like enzyme